MEVLDRPSRELICLIIFSSLTLIQPIFAQEQETIYAAIQRFSSDALVSDSEAYIQSNLHCVKKYGFLPCSDKVFGNLFLLVLYVLLMFTAAQIMAKAGEMLLSVSSPGIVGVLLSILGALPDMLLLLSSGLAGNAEDVKSQIQVGMGLLAGSTVMWLTLMWGSSHVVGRCDLYEGSRAKDGRLTRKFDICNTGVSTDRKTRVAAWIMTIAVLPYIIAQIPDAINKPQLLYLFATIGCGLAFLGLLIFCAIQVFYPWIHERRIFMAKDQLWRTSILYRAVIHSSGQFKSLVLEDGKTPNMETINKLFKAIDKGSDENLSEKELKAFLVGLGVSSDNLDEHLSIDEQAKKWMGDFDFSNDGYIQQAEFNDGMVRWVTSIIAKAKERSSYVDKPVFWREESQEARRHVEALLDKAEKVSDDEDKDEDDSVQAPSQGMVIFKASIIKLCGAALAAVFSGPLVNAITSFSTATKIPSFFISFIATPLATNSSAAASYLIFASRKKKRNMSMACSQIYCAVALNHTLHLGIFLAVVVIRGLDWNFSAEVTTIAVVTIVMGILGGTRTTFPLWMGILALALYPISVGMVVIFDYVLHWT